MKEHFTKLYQISVKDHTEEKNGLTYLSWAWAWAEVKKIYPDATYEIEKFENNLPYVFDEKTGYLVFTNMTIENITYEMWLPVMDSANKAMKNESYEYSVKYWDKESKTYKYTKKTVAVATMFDINKTIMRCLVKNLAMFGLGLYIYAGEDLPEDLTKDDETPSPEVKKATKSVSKKVVVKEEPKKVEIKATDLATPEQLKILSQLSDTNKQKALVNYKVDSLEKLTIRQAMELIKMMNAKKAEKEK